MSEDEKRLSEEMATRLWQRAAEMQAEAARRLEARAREEGADELDDEVGEDGYSLVHVRAAAEEAGISPEFVNAALAEVAAESAVGASRKNAFDRAADRFLSELPEVLEVRRMIEASAEDVYSAMQRVFPGHPYQLNLTDFRGGDPLEGGVMVFDLGALTQAAMGGFRYECYWADIKQLLVSIHPVAGESDMCEVVVRSPMQRGRRNNTILGLILTGFAGFGGAAGGLGAGMALGAGLLGLGSSALLPLVVVLATLGGASTAVLGRAGYRALYRYGLGRGIKALEGMLGSLNVAATSRWGSALPAPPQDPPRGGDSGLPAGFLDGFS